MGSYLYVTNYLRKYSKLLLDIVRSQLNAVAPNNRLIHEYLQALINIHDYLFDCILQTKNKLVLLQLIKHFICSEDNHPVYFTVF